MKTLLLFISLLFATLVAPAQGVQFEDLTLEEALVKARQENKLIFIDGYTAWCAPCKLMDTQVFPLPEAGEYFNARFVCLKYNMEQEGDGLTLAKRFGVRAYPTFIILDTDDNLIHLFAGGILDLTFLDKVEEAFDENKALGNLQRRYEAGERDKPLVARYIQALEKTHTRDAAPIIEELHTALTDDEMTRPDYLFLFDEYHAPVGTPRAAYLIDHLARFREDLGRTRVDSLLVKKYAARYMQLLRSSPTLADLDATRATLDTLGLLSADLLDIYDATLRLKASAGKDDDGALLSLIKERRPLIVPLDLDLFLYTVLSYMKDAWDAPSLDELISLASSDYNREAIRKAARL